MHRCLDCGEYFETPAKRRVKENLDGENGWWTGVILYCPACGSEYIAQVDDDAED